MGVKKYEISQKPQSLFSTLFSSLLRNKKPDNVYEFLASIGYSEGGIHYYIFINDSFFQAIGMISLYAYDCIISIDNPAFHKVIIWVVPYKDIRSISLEEDIRLGFSYDNRTYEFSIAIPQKVEKNLPTERKVHEEKTANLFNLIENKITVKKLV